MGLFSGPTLASLLDAERDLLDGIFGKGAWRIESTEDRQATLRSGLLDAHFGWERDSAIGALIVLHDSPEGANGEAETWLWSKYLELDTPPSPRDSDGLVLAAPDEQLKDELTRIARLVKDVFSNPQAARDASFYVHGYTMAYNDWASGGW